MSPTKELPASTQQIFQQIDNEYETNDLDWKPTLVGKKWLREQLPQASETHGITPTSKSLLLDYYQWQLVELAKPANGGPFPVSIKDFFRAVYEQFTDNKRGVCNGKLANVLSRGKVEPICIGRLNGGDDKLYLSRLLSCDAPASHESKVQNSPYNRNDGKHRYICYGA